MKELKPMKHLMMVAATPLTTVEAGINMLNRRLVRLGEPELRVTILCLGRARPTIQHSLYISELVIFLGANSYRANQDFINIKSIGVLLDDAMTMACITGPGVSRADWEPKGNGMGYLLRELDAKGVAKLLWRAHRAKYVDGTVNVSQLDYIPTILNAVNDTVSFVGDLAALNYSIRDEIYRNRLRAAFLTWVRGPGGPKQLVEGIVSATAGRDSKGRPAGISPGNSRLQILQQFFVDNPKVKKVLQNIASALDNKKPVPFDKLASSVGISAYDLRYISKMMQKNPPLVEMANSESVHRERNSGRFAVADGDETVTAQEDVA